MNLKETHQHKVRFHYNLLNISRREIIEPLVLPAAIITFIGYISYGVILTLIPDWSEHLGIANKGSFFIVFTLSSLFVRFTAGKLSDKKGRIIILKYAFAMLILSLLMIGLAKSVILLMSGSFIYGIAVGLFSPASNAWTADLSNPDFRGRAMATMYIALEAGIGIGALLAGIVFHDQYQRIPWIFCGAAFINLIGLTYLIRLKKTIRVNTST
ncbi:MAG TPA: MFS transporter [Flavisolibacter sp.]|nr:MFS transporter [Flavisolibacter sp.]